MHFVLLLFTLLIGLPRRVVSAAAVETTLEPFDLEDGHPNHQLWQKMIDTARSSVSDR